MDLTWICVIFVCFCHLRAILHSMLYGDAMKQGQQQNRGGGLRRNHSSHHHIFRVSYVVALRSPQSPTTTPLPNPCHSTSETLPKQIPLIAMFAKLLSPLKLAYLPFQSTLAPSRRVRFPKPVRPCSEIPRHPSEFSPLLRHFLTSGVRA